MTSNDGATILAHANSLLSEGKYSEARDEFQKAIQLGHNSWESHWGLARAAKGLGDVALVDQECGLVQAAKPDFWFAQELPKHVRGYYGQVGQDKVIEEFFQKYPTENRFFVEVGAFDGVNFSNVRRLHEKYGWTGLCVEPVRKNFEMLRRSYEGTPIRCVRSAVSTQEGEVEIAVSTYPHLPDWGSDTATLNPAEMDRWNYLNTQWTKEKTPLRTLTSILDEQGIEAFDVLSIDTEGNDLEVLKSLDFSRFHPTLIVVEYFGTPPEVFAGYLRDKGYTILHDNGQDVFLQYVPAVERAAKPAAADPSQAMPPAGRVLRMDDGPLAAAGPHVPITFMTTAYNEEERIRFVLDHATRWADEVVVINKASTDRTKEICIEYGDKVRVVDVPFVRLGSDDMASYTALASNDWVYWATASEIPTRKLIRTIRHFLSAQSDDFDLIYIPRKIYSFGIHSQMSPWSVSYYPFLINRNRVVISDAIHRNFESRDPNRTARIDFSDECCVYHLTHTTAKDYMQLISMYFEGEAAACQDPDAMIRECFTNISKYEEQLRSGGDDLMGHYFAWPIYWLGTALFLWEKKRGKDVPQFYRALKADILRREWQVEGPAETLLWDPAKPVATEDDLLRELEGRPIASEIKTLYVIGAHRFQERELFDRLFPNLENIYLFEPLPAFHKHLKASLAEDRRIRVFPYAISDSNGRAKFHVTNNDAASSSLLPLAGHRKLFPQVQVQDTILVQTRTLDSAIAEHALAEPDMLLLDVQGAEFSVISSISQKVRDRAKLIYTEASKEELYEGARTLDDVASVLAPQYAFLGFAPLANYTPTHGNALFANQRDLDALVRPRASAPPAVGSTTGSGTGDEKYLVSAIVSAYKSERFIRGCLEDLEAQTIAGRLEIVVVDTGSPQNERAVVEEFQRRYDNIVYLRSEEREGVYAAWNKGIKAARGKYITNANTDDRHRADFMERMASVLESRPDIALAYANVHITETENETFDSHRPVGAYRWLDFSPLQLIYGCFMGPQPMWRRSVHERYGYFDESYESAGDWEFWLRIAETETFLHVDDFLGLYLKSPTSAEHRDRDLSTREARRVHEKYLPRAARLRSQFQAAATAGEGASAGRATTVVRQASPVLLVENGRPASSTWQSLVGSTSRPLAVTVLAGASGEGSGRERLAVPAEWRVVAGEGNPVSALNRALLEAGERPVALLSADVTVTPGWLDMLTDALERDRGLAVVAPLSNQAPEPQRIGAKYAGAGKELRRFAEQRARQHGEEVKETRYAGGFCLALSPRLCREAGLLNEELDPATALWDLFGRLGERGHRIGIAMGSYVHHEKLTQDEGAGFDALAATEEAVARSIAAGEAALAQGDAAGAVEEFAALSSRFPELAVAHSALGTALTAAGREQEAVDAFRRAVDLAPADASQRNQLGVALYRIGQFEDAEAVFARAHQDAPNNIDTLLNLVDLHRAQGRYAEATEAIKKAVDTDANCPDVLVALGVLGLDLGDLSATEIAAQRLEELQPGSQAAAELQAALTQARTAAPATPREEAKVCAK